MCSFIKKSVPPLTIFNLYPHAIHGAWWRVNSEKFRNLTFLQYSILFNNEALGYKSGHRLCFRKFVPESQMPAFQVWNPFWFGSNELQPLKQRLEGLCQPPLSPRDDRSSHSSGSERGNVCVWDSLWAWVNASRHF